MYKLISNILTISGAFIFIAFGAAYLYKSASLKNHCAAVQRKLTELDVENRILVFALMRGAGGSVIGLGILIIYLQLTEAKEVGNIKGFIILISSLVFFFSSYSSMLTVRRKTYMKPPATFLLAAGVMIILGFILNIISTL